MSKRIAMLSAVAFSALALTSTFVAPVRAEENFRSSDGIVETASFQINEVFFYF